MGTDSTWKYLKLVDSMPQRIEECIDNNDIKIVKNKNLSAEIGHQFYKFNDKFVFNFTIIKM